MNRKREEREEWTKHYYYYYYCYACPLKRRSDLPLTELTFCTLLPWDMGNVRLGHKFGTSFGHGAGDSSPTLREGHCGIFNIHQLMLADRTPSLPSIRATTHTSMADPACKATGWQFMCEPTFKPS